MTQFEDKKQNDLIINEATRIDLNDASFTAARPQESNYEPILNELVKYTAGTDSYVPVRESYENYTRATTPSETLDPKGESHNAAGTLLSSNIAEILDATDGRALSVINTPPNETNITTNRNEDSIESIREYALSL